MKGQKNEYDNPLSGKLTSLLIGRFFVQIYEYWEMRQCMKKK